MRGRGDVEAERSPPEHAGAEKVRLLESRIAALIGQDPIVKAGVGYYEHFPMLQLRAR